MGKINRTDILMSESDIWEFHCATDEVTDTPMSKEQIVDFMEVNSSIYYQGKEWGFNDTEVREWICDKIRLTACVNSEKLVGTTNE
jgi:hypothetical protein